MDALNQLWQSPQEAFSLIGLMTTRLVMCMTVAPVLTPAQTPWSIRTGIAASVVLPMLLPSLQSGHIASESPYWILALTLKEAAVGMFIGFIVAIPIWIAEGFGILFDNERGAMTGGTFNPMIASPSPIGALLQYLAVVVILSTTCGDALFKSIAWSFSFWRPEDLLPAVGRIDLPMLISLFAEMNQLMVLYFLPMLALLMMLEFGLALISVYAPSLQAFQMAMPVKSYAGLLMLIAALGLFWTSWQQQTWDYFVRVCNLFGGNI